MVASQDTLVTVQDEDDTDDSHFSASAYIYKLRIVVMHTKVQSRLGYSGVRSETQSFHYTILLKVDTGSPSLVGLLGSLTMSDLPSPRIRTKISYMKPLEGSLYTTEIIKFGVYRGMLWSVTMMPTSLLLLEAPPSMSISYLVDLLLNSSCIGAEKKRRSNSSFEPRSGRMKPSRPMYDKKPQPYNKVTDASSYTYWVLARQSREGREFDVVDLRSGIVVACDRLGWDLSDSRVYVEWL
jgi:hypothetical protein